MKELKGSNNPLWLLVEELDAAAVTLWHVASGDTGPYAHHMFPPEPFYSFTSIYMEIKGIDTNAPAGISMKQRDVWLDNLCCDASHCFA